MRCIILPAALDDLTDIGLYIARDNPARAESYVEEIEEYCFDLAKTPGMGRARPEIAAKLRSMPFGSYIVFYSVHREEIRVERGLHSARDIEKIMSNQ